MVETQLITYRMQTGTSDEAGNDLSRNQTEKEKDQGEVSPNRFIELVCIIMGTQTAITCRLEVLTKQNQDLQATTLQPPLSPAPQIH